MDFVDQLMWSATPAPGRWQRPVLYRAPSWSWCAIDCPVQISESDRSEKREENKLAHIEEAAVTLRGEDEFGEVTGGFLRIRCLLFQAGAFTQHHQRGSFQLGEYKFETHTTLDERPASSVRVPPDGMFYMPFDWHGHSQKHSVRGLILKKSHRQDADEYTRVGVFGWEWSNFLQWPIKEPGRIAFEHLRSHVPHQTIRLL